MQRMCQQKEPQKVIPLNINQIEKIADYLSSDKSALGCKNNIYIFLQ